MEKPSRDPSTYGAIFAVFAVFVVIVVLAYFGTEKLYNAEQTLQDIREQDFVVRGIQEIDSVSIDDEGTVLYENLTDEEADELIKSILESGFSNEEKIEVLEASISS